MSVLITEPSKKELTKIDDFKLTKKKKLKHLDCRPQDGRDYI
jgi:hypothetical protein